MTEVANPASADQLDHETLGDRQVRDLIERYVALSGATLTELGPHLYELHVPQADRVAFSNRPSIRLAFSVEAVQTDAEAEMAIVGGLFVEQLITAIRRRGWRFRAGHVGVGVANAAQHPPLPASVRRGRATEGQSSFAVHRIGRLTARIVIRAGTSLEEHLVESGVFDTTTGLLMSPAIAAECEAAAAAPETGAVPTHVALAPSRPANEFVPRMLGDLKETLEPELRRVHEKAERDFAHERGRIERYYQTLLEDAGGRGTGIPDRETRLVFEGERDRRLAEERDRHQVRATVHPVQLTEWDVVVQGVEWQLESSDGHRGKASAQRVLAGEMSWMFGCPTCGLASPAELAVCMHDHAACGTCARDCSVCHSAFCQEHGIATCHVDGQPACDAHARTCVCCHRVHCAAHEAECADGGHPACGSCLGSCASCGRSVCDSHARSSLETAPRGARRFCWECARTCEGGTNEVVGPDEVTGCATCERVVCEHHQAKCAVDGKVHCSKHLRRADRSRRLVCERDRAECAYEPTAVFAVDEIGTCVTCGAGACELHTAKCVEDGRLHCRAHMVELVDRQGGMACETHRTVCHVDGGSFSLAGTQECPVCARLACRRHLNECRSCGRHYCTADRTAEGLCLTCNNLTTAADPTDAMLSAAVALFADPGKAKSWRSARDATHVVVEADLGWTRKVTFAMRHGANRAETARMRSVLGSRRLKTTSTPTSS